MTEILLDCGFDRNSATLKWSLLYFKTNNQDLESEREKSKIRILLSLSHAPYSANNF